MGAEASKPLRTLPRKLSSASLSVVGAEKKSHSLGSSSLSNGGGGGGGGGGSSSASASSANPSLHNPMAQTERENLNAWHRDGVSVWDVYELVEVIGQGHMGEVYKVRKKGGAHNATTRGRQAERAREVAAAAAAATSENRGRDGGKHRGERHRSRSRSKSPYPVSKTKKLIQKAKNKTSKTKKGSKSKKQCEEDNELRPPMPEATPAKQPCKDKDMPRKSILKHSRYTDKASDEDESQESEEGSSRVDDSEERDDDHEVHSTVSEEANLVEKDALEGREGDGDADTKKEKTKTKTTGEPNGDSGEDEEEDEYLMDNATYMKKWQERLKGAKEERMKVLEKVESEQANHSESSGQSRATSFSSIDGGGNGHGEEEKEGEEPATGMILEREDSTRSNGSSSLPRTNSSSSLRSSNRGSIQGPASPVGGGGKTIRFQRMYACKTVLTTHVKKGFVDQLLNEIAIMKNLDHPFILQLLEVYQVKRSIWLITELCTGGDLTSRKLDEPQSTIVLEQILRALTYLHRLGICHRDIKLENILYEHGGKDASIRLIDFGLSMAFDRSSDVKRKAVGTAYTLSPEIASGEGKYTTKTDIWALGVVAWILLAGDAPFIRDHDELKDKAKLKKLLTANFQFGITWSGRGISDYGKDFVRRCLKRNPGDRWSAKEALDYVQTTWIPKLEGNYEGKEAAQKLARSISARRRSKDAADINVEDVHRFCSYGRLKKTILMTMARTMERDEVDRLRELFLTVDTEDTGTISFAELRDCLGRLNSSIDDKEIEKIFVGIDQDRSGKIHWAEFLAALSESHGLVTMDRLAAVFERLDTEGKGYISHENLKVILGQDYDKKVVDSMIEEADFKKNGQIDYEEFLHLMFENPESGDVAVGRINDSGTILNGLLGK